MRFCLIDQITELKRGESITAIKNLSMAEEYLQDHFPGFPVIPGVLMLEAMVQTSAWLLRDMTDFAFSTILLKEAKAIKFNHFLQPGKTLTVQSSLHKQDGDLVTFKASGTIEGTSTVSTRLTLKQFNLADRDSSLESADQRNLEHFRGLFKQLWKQDEAVSL